MKHGMTWLYAAGLSTAPVTLALAQDNSAVPAVAGEALRDIHGPVGFPGNPLIILFIVLAALAAGFLIYKKFKPAPKTIEPGPIDTRAPWEIALDELNHLSQKKLLDQGFFKEYYSALSDIIRSYFERRFNVKAPEMTTEEFLWSLEGSQDLLSEQKATLKKFLNSCDIVKFAKYVPATEEARASFTFAKQLVEQTAPPKEADTLPAPEQNVL